MSCGQANLPMCPTSYLPTLIIFPLAAPSWEIVVRSFSILHALQRKRQQQEAFVCLAAMKKRRTTTSFRRPQRGLLPGRKQKHLQPAFVLAEKLKICSQSLLYFLNNGSCCWNGNPSGKSEKTKIEGPTTKWKDKRGQRVCTTIETRKAYADLFCKP